MGAFDDKFWNLAQAAAWVEYRSQALVDEFESASRDAYVASKFYPTHADLKIVAALSELHRNLVNARITAWGRSREPGAEFEEISAIEWTNLRLDPPHATRRHPLSGTIEPWTDIRLESAALKKRWRSVHEITGRTKFNWKLIRGIHDQLKSANPEFSQNALIQEIELEYQAQSHKEPPSRSTIQRHLKDWD